MHLPFTAHIRARQMYMTIMYTRLKRAAMCASFYYLGYSTVLISVQDDDAVDVLRRMNYLIKEGF